MRPVARGGPTAAPPPSASPKIEPAPSAPARPAPGPPTPSRFAITVIAGQAVGQRFRLGGAGCMIGRSRGAILFPEDIFVSPHHATLVLRDGKLFIRDEGSLSGVFVTLSGGHEPVGAGQFFAAGERLFRYVGALPHRLPMGPALPIPYGAPHPGGQALHAVEEVLVGGRPGRAVTSVGPSLAIGQQQCDLSYAGDAGLALRHCELTLAAEGAMLRDLSGGRGTFMRLSPGAERALAPGDRIRIGLHVIQVDLLS